MPMLDGGPYVWSDWLGEQDAHTNYFRPQSVSQLIEFLELFPDVRKLHIRAVGSGGSTSDVARPWRIAGNDAKRAGIVLHMEDVGLEWKDEAKSWWRADFPAIFPGEILHRARAGMTYNQLSAELAGLTPKKAMPNLGSYDRQTLIGGAATGTHGTGMTTGPLADLIVSMEMIAILRAPGTNQPVVKHVRVEPHDGPTDHGAFEAARAGGKHDMELIADDDAFYSAVVGLGYFGIVTALTLRVRSAFWLEEKKTRMSWPALSAQLPTRADQDFFDFLIAPRPTTRGGGGLLYRCLATERTALPSQGAGAPRDDPRTIELRQKMKLLKKDRMSLTYYLAELASANPRFAAKATLDVFEKEEKLTQLSASDHVFRTSIGKYVLATSAEVFVPFDKVVPAVETLIEHLDAQRKKGRNHTSPIGVRFSQASKHYLAMQYGRKTCTLEAPLLLGTRVDGKPETKSISDQIIGEMLYELEVRMKKNVGLDARMHHGQRNWSTRADLERYPKFQAWWKQYQRFNAFGIFSNAASARWGLDPV